MSEVKEQLSLDEKCGKIVDDLIGAEHPAELREKIHLMWDRYALSESTTDERAEIYEAYQIIDKALEAMEEFAA